MSSTVVEAMGVGKRYDEEVIYAIRPIYLTADGEHRGVSRGLFKSRDKKNPSKVDRVFKVKAKPGYAVGGVTARHDLMFNAMYVTFMRIKGQALDPRDSYTSAWIGSDSGGREASVNCNGAPVVGLFGNQDERQVLALGLFYVSDGAHAAPPPRQADAA